MYFKTHQSLLGSSFVDAAYLAQNGVGLNLLSTDLLNDSSLISQSEKLPCFSSPHAVALTFPLPFLSS